MHRTIDELKRRAYSVMALLGLASTVMPWIFTITREPYRVQTVFDTVTYPLMTAAFIALIWVLYTTRVPPCTAERLAMALVTTYYLARLILALFNPDDLGPIHIQAAEATYWQVLALTVAGFLVYEFRQGMTYVTSVYVVTLGLHVAAVALHTPPGTGTSQYIELLASHAQLASVVTLVCVLGHTKESWMRLGREAQAMRRLAHIDPLTEVSNRRRLDAALADAIKQGRTPLTVIMFDIDSFKEINDAHGHSIGDRVLVATASIVQRVVRKVDSFGRWGGEEFLVLCPSTDLEMGWHIAERLREAISSHEYDHVGMITASFGVAEYQEGESPEDLLARADNVLYLAKARGKNRVEAAPSEDPVA